MPLSQFRMLEIGDLPAASCCARLLSDLGAAVIRLRGPDAVAPSPDTLDGAWSGFLHFGKPCALSDAAAVILHSATGETPARTGSRITCMRRTTCSAAGARMRGCWRRSWTTPHGWASRRPTWPALRSAASPAPSPLRRGGARSRYRRDRAAVGRGLGRFVPIRAGNGLGRAGRHLRRVRRGARGHGRRKRLRQDRHRPGAAAPAAAPHRPAARARGVRGPGPAAPAGAGHAARARQPDRHDPPGTHERAGPGVHGRRADRGNAARPPRPRPPRGAGTGGSSRSCSRTPTPRSTRA